MRQLVERRSLVGEDEGSGPEVGEARTGRIGAKQAQRNWATGDQRAKQLTGIF